MNISEAIKTSINGDEYYTLKESVDMIIPYILGRGYKSVWCPFDTEESEFVKSFKALGMEVVYGHIKTGQDFFEYDMPQAEIVVSNPPFSKRQKIFEKLYEWDIPFALIMNFNGLFDSKARVELFKNHEIQMLVPHGRMKFFAKEKGMLNSPNFQSIYVCNHLLDKQIVFDDTKF